MRDGSTRQIDLETRPDEGFAKFARDWQVSLVLASGSDAGSDFATRYPGSTCWVEARRQTFASRTPRFPVNTRRSSSWETATGCATWEA